MEKEVLKYYQSLNQDIRATQLSREDGGNSEQIFTQIALNNLADAGETENAILAYDKKAVGTKNQHQINGFAISDNYETLDLFITVFKGTNEISATTKAEIETAQKRISNFFNKCINKEYVNEIEESSEIFQLANTLANYDEIKENLVRVNVIILTDGEYKGDFPKNDKINNYNMFYRVIDIHFLYKISEQSRIPIEIDLNDIDGEKFEVLCLPASVINPKFKAYIAILPGTCLAKLYERYGARLLEQNVRSFLQVGGRNSVNYGIRSTIRNEPEKFFAYNNGIAATADNIELDDSGRYITKIRNLQIVNGGQTTASIYNTAKKDKADISKIFVQVKFSVIENPEEYSDIVSLISKYANTQNKVNNADFSANNPALVAFEKLSRFILSPISATNNIQTSWFFERARGQYKTLRSREGRTKTLQIAFDRKYPKKQMFSKVELAKYINSYQEVYDGKKLLIGPHIVVRGNEKNYAQFIGNNLPENVKKINNVYFEDAIAKCILFKNADKRYGIKPNSIGEMKQVVVPYTLSLLNIITENQLDLFKIWKNQDVSPELSDFIFDLMKQVNHFILETYKGQHYIEKAKKEECWDLVKNHEWDFNLKDIKADLIDPKNPPRRNIEVDIAEAELEENKSIIKSIPPGLWNEILRWGKDSEMLDTIKLTVVSNIAFKLRQNIILSEDEFQKGIEILDIVAKYNEELLQKTEEFAGKWVALKKPKLEDEQKNDLIKGLVKKMIGFVNTHKKDLLTQDEKDYIYDILNGKKYIDSEAQDKIYKLLKKLEKVGFKS
ncbi:MAG: AIPR family protein [Ignavibacteria bacterium]|nr:AIPR family protein [Ignavibacteria bacterium]